MCKTCGATAITDGKCEKCGTTASLEDYGFKIQKLRGKSYLLLKDESTEPILTFSNLTSRLEKQSIAKTASAPLSAVEKSLATLALENGEEPKISTPTSSTEQSLTFDEETHRKAWQLLRDPALFYKLGKVFERGFIIPKVNKPRFVLGEERNKRLLGPLMIGAAKLGMTSLVRVIGEPGTAKDSMVRMWLKILPIKYLERSYLTAAAIRYSQNVQNCELLYIPDSPELHGETGRQLLFMRADDGGLISEYATRDTETGEMTTKTVTLPVKGVVTTSNQVIAGAALLSGMWTLNTNADLDLTKQVKEEKLKLRAGNRKLFPEEQLKVWQCAFQILLQEEAPTEISVPYADKLISILESERSESRRDPDRLCDLVTLVAWMRRFQKKEELRGEADTADLFIALQIGLDAISQTIAELNEREERVYQAIAANTDATCRQVAETTKIAYKTAYRILESLVEKGYLNMEQEKGRNHYSILKKKQPAALLFSEGRNSNDPEKLLELISASLTNSSHGHWGGDSEKFLVDPLTAKRVTINQDLTYLVENALPEDLEYSSEKFFTAVPGVQGGSAEASQNQALNGEQTPKTLLHLEMIREKSVFLFERVKPAEPCEYCGVHAVEFEVTLPNGEGKVRKCAGCFEELRFKFNRAEWRAIERTA
jgi:hypothetical protein